MGYAFIVHVHRDGIEAAERSPTARQAVGVALGEAVLHACLRGSLSTAPRSSPVLGHANCVVACDEVRATDSRLYLWAGNCLRPLHRLDDAGLEHVASLVEEERRRRAET